MPGVEPFILGYSRGQWPQPMRTVRPLMTNSDHANFAQGGIPALRLVAGFDYPAANLRVVPNPADTRDKVGQGELRAATLFTAALVAAACNADLAEAGEVAAAKKPPSSRPKPSVQARRRTSDAGPSKKKKKRRIDERGPRLRRPWEAPLGMTSG